MIIWSWFVVLFEKKRCPPKIKFLNPLLNGFHLSKLKETLSNFHFVNDAKLTLSWSYCFAEVDSWNSQISIHRRCRCRCHLLQNRNSFFFFFFGYYICPQLSSILNHLILISEGNRTIFFFKSILYFTLSWLTQLCCAGQDLEKV